jgi:pimeloyl-ACP methyl ester carboxylesterase
VIAQARRSGVDAARKVWQAHPLLAPASEKPQVAKQLAEMTATYTGWHWLHADPQESSAPAAIERLATIRAPTLIVVGERDLSDFHRIAELLASIIPRAKRVVLPGVGHIANMEAPIEFNNVVLAFLQRGLVT